MIAKIKELIELLEWALDLIDMYDERLSQVDGPELVYTKMHVQMKARVREVLEEWKKAPIW